ncbi:type IIL restriction-modification enzyme MmeI [Vibrio harveyi]
MRLVAMRLKSDYSYGNKVVYNTFPWPSPNEQQRQNLVQLAENILLAREDYPGKTLAELYNPDSMPDDLKNAHAELDNAVDKLYRDKPFRDTADRLSFLLARYEAMVAKQEE